jgi:hypothetical protein
VHLKLINEMKVEGEFLNPQEEERKYDFKMSERILKNVRDLEDDHRLTEAKLESKVAEMKDYMT